MDSLPVIHLCVHVLCEKEGKITLHICKSFKIRSECFIIIFSYSRCIFRTIQSCLITLFQLLTLDHWHDIYKDVTKVVNPWFAGLYIILWICIGSFVFRNIFVGIMGNY